MTDDFLHTLSETWPWSVPADQFGLWFLLLAGFASLVGVGVGKVFADAVDGPAPPLGTPAASQNPLVVGQLPRAADVPLVAWLRAGREGLAELLFFTAVSEGWLVIDARGHGAVHDMAPSDRGQELFQRELAQSPTLNVRAALFRASAAVARELNERAIRVGLARNSSQRGHVVLASLSGVAAAGVVGAIKCALDPQVDPDLVIVLTLTPLPPTVFIGTFVSMRHRRAREYLSWIQQGTRALREDVKAKRGRPGDATLVVALMGISSLDSPDIAAAHGRALQRQR